MAASEKFLYSSSVSSSYNLLVLVVYGMMSRQSSGAAVHISPLKLMLIIFTTMNSDNSWYLLTDIGDNLTKNETHYIDIVYV